MAHYAFLNENNIVTEVIVGIDETELIEGLNPQIWYGNFKNQKCIRTSYNNNIRKQFAGIGYFYDSINDIFIAPQPYLSWTMDSNFDWQPPTPMPLSEAAWYWDENTLNWIEQVEQFTPSLTDADKS